MLNLGFRQINGAGMFMLILSLIEGLGGQGVERTNSWAVRSHDF